MIAEYGFGSYSRPVCPQEKYPGSLFVQRGLNPSTLNFEDPTATIFREKPATSVPKSEGYTFVKPIIIRSAPGSPFPPAIAA